MIAPLISFQLDPTGTFSLFGFTSFSRIFTLDLSIFYAKSKLGPKKSKNNTTTRN
jgi:hypothetical protein